MTVIRFILNDTDIATELRPGITVLDLVRYHQNLTGTKIGCREGDCGACTVLVGELVGENVKYRSMTSCLMPLANAVGKHIVTIEGINPPDGTLTPVQQALVDESGTQCGFCTVGFVMSLTGFCIDDSPKVPEAAVSAVDGNICRCTGYKSIERAAERVCRQLTDGRHGKFVPDYFSTVPRRLAEMKNGERQRSTAERQLFVGGGTDVYVQKPDEMAEGDAEHLFYNDELRGIREAGEFVEIGASSTVTDLLESPVMQSVFPDLYKHLKLVSSTPIRNMATLAGNFVNASPIGDMTVWFLALDSEIDLSGGDANVNERARDQEAGALHDGRIAARTIKLRDLYVGYKQLDKQPGEIIRTIRFRKPAGDLRFNFEKVSKRTYLDIATVNTAISLRVKSTPGPGWIPPALSEPPASASGLFAGAKDGRSEIEHTIIEAHVAAGGVAPIPLYLKETSAFLKGKQVTEETIIAANEIMQAEISPISDVRGSAQYKRLLLRQLFRAHFMELFVL